MICVSRCSQNHGRNRRTFGVFVLERLVHSLQLLLPLLRQLLFLLLTTLEPFEGIVYIPIGITESCTLELCIELPLVPYPTKSAE